MAPGENEKLRRRPPTNVEIAARVYRATHRTFTFKTEPDRLSLDEEIADHVAIIQRGWDRLTERIRWYGINDIPRGAKRNVVLQRLHKELAHQVVPFIRVYKTDRYKFKHQMFVRLRF
jgi:hypothetical protein